MHVTEGNSASKQHKQVGLFRDTHLKTSIDWTSCRSRCSLCTHISRNEALLLLGGKQTKPQRQLLALLFSFKTRDQEKAGDSLKGGGEEEKQPTERFPSWRRAGSSLRQRAAVGPRAVGHSVERGGGSTLKPRAGAQHFGSLRAHCDTSSKRWPACGLAAKVHSLLSSCVFFLPLSRNSWRKWGSAAEGKGARCIFYLFLKPSAAEATELNVSTHSIPTRVNVQAPVCIEPPFESGRGDTTPAQVTHRCLLANCGNVLQRLLVVQLRFLSFFCVRKGIGVKMQSGSLAETVAL